MGAHRQAAQVDQGVRWLLQAWASTGRVQPTLAGGRDGVQAPWRHGAWQEGATATGSVMDRRGQRVGTVSRGPRPAAGQTPLTTQWPALLQDIFPHVDAHGLRVVAVSDDGYHPRDSDHPVLKQRRAPTRPWCTLAWRRMGDSSHACLAIPPWADALFGPSLKGRAWAQQLRKPFKTPSDGSPRVGQSAGAFRRQYGLWGKAKASDHASASLTKRTHGRRSRHSSSQHLPSGSGLTEAAWKTVVAPRLKRSGMSWTIAGGQGILVLRVIWLSGVWEHVHQRYLASQPMPMTQEEMAKVAQPRPQAASLIGNGAITPKAKGASSPLLSLPHRAGLS